jgi:thioredoxin reductase
MTYDVVVIGGGAAGLSGALALVRSRRSVLVIDSGQPRNAPTDGVHNFLTRDGTPPAELYRLGRTEVAGYGGEFRDGEVVSARSVGGLFRVRMAGGEEVEARRLLVTTGLTDELPEIPGLAERWGKDVLHCPYCHGWEVRDQRIGVLGSPTTGHQAPLFRQLSEHVVVLANGMDGVEVPGIPTETGVVTALEVADDRLTGVRLDDGRVLPLDALVVAPRLRARAGFLADLGLKTVEGESGAVVPSEAGGVTDVPGVWVAGNVTDATIQVIGAAAAGLMAGARINSDLIAGSGVVGRPAAAH